VAGGGEEAIQLGLGVCRQVASRMCESRCCGGGGREREGAREEEEKKQENVIQSL
jgi:hypothetical protein